MINNKVDFKTKFWRWFICDLPPYSVRKVIKVKSITPALYKNDKNKWELSWPVLLVDTNMHRATISPVWDKIQWKIFFLRFLDKV